MTSRILMLVAGASPAGIDVVIDSATPLYNFNLKSHLQTNGLWPATGPMVINTLTITARTTIRFPDMTVRVPDFWGGQSAAPTQYSGWRTHIAAAAGSTNDIGGTIHDPIYLYSQDLSIHAFTTGDGWPSGSLIRTINVLGKIIGRGGDGQGLTGLTSGTYRSTPSGGTTQTLTLKGYVSRRHGWPAMEIKVPVNQLNVSGLVAGGGAGGSYPGPIVRSVYLTGDGREEASKAQVRALMSRITANMTSKEIFDAGMPLSFGYIDLQTSDVFSSIGAIKSGIGDGSYETSSPFFAPTFGGDAKALMHGCGGGQGGGLGGVSVKMTSSSDGTFYYTYTNGTDGGSGTDSAPGGAGTTPVHYTTNDTKVGLSGSVYGGGIQGASFGADSTSKLDVYSAPYNTPGTVYTRMNLDTSAELTGVSSLYISSVALWARGGNAVTGNSFIASIPSIMNIKGRVV